MSHHTHARHADDRNTYRDVSTMSLDARFDEYLATLDRAIHAHQDEGIYAKLFEVAGSALKDKTMGVGVYKTDAGQPHSWYTIKFEGDHFKLVARSKADPDITWKTQEAHIDEVVGDPQRFIDQPARLDLSWLKSRLGLSLN